MSSTMKDTDVAHALVTAMTARMRAYVDSAEQCLGTLDDQQIWSGWLTGEDAVGSLVLRIAGNLDEVVDSIEGRESEDAPLDIRVRSPKSKEDLRAALRRSMEACTRVVDSVPPDRMGNSCRIRGRETTVAYALIGAASQFSLHLGRMLFLSRTLGHFSGAPAATS